MSEPKKKKLRGAAGELMRALQITPDDIEANEQGYITDHQRETLITRESQQFAPLYIPVLIAVVTLDNTYNRGKLEINGMELKANPDILRRIRHLEPYIVHYLEDSKIVLSMAHLDDEANIRQDDSAAASRLQEHAAVDSDSADIYDERDAASERTQSS